MKSLIAIALLTILSVPAYAMCYLPPPPYCVDPGSRLCEMQRQHYEQQRWQYEQCKQMEEQLRNQRRGY